MKTIEIEIREDGEVRIFGCDELVQWLEERRFRLSVRPRGGLAEDVEVDETTMTERMAKWMYGVD